MALASKPSRKSYNRYSYFGTEKDMRCGALLLVLAIGGGSAWAASTSARPAQSAAVPFALSAADLPPLAPAPLYRAGSKTLPERERNPLAAVFGAGWLSRQHRAERCEQLPKVGASEFYPLFARQAFAQSPGGTLVLYPAARDFQVSDYPMYFADQSLNLYMLCLQGLIH